MITVAVTNGELVIQEYFFAEERRDEVAEVLAALERGWRMEKKA